MALPPSTEKEHLREPGPDAPRVARRDGQIPRVLFTSPECRIVVIELGRGETMGDHRVRERAIVQVVSGRVSIETSGESAECDAGALVTFDPGEPHSLRAHENTRLLLLLAPWPAPEHYTGSETERAQHLPANARVEPSSSDEQP
jgi:quercetin dioxygenase-like cupin family protein